MVVVRRRLLPLPVSGLLLLLLLLGGRRGCIVPYYMEDPGLTSII